MVLSLVYIVISFASLYPFSLIARAYERKINLDLTLKELEEVGKKLSTLSPQKEKKIRALRARYVKLRRRISNLVLINLISIWIAVFVGMLLSRYACLALSNILGTPPYINAPFNIPFITVNGYLNDALLFLAVIVAYYPIHSRVSGLYKLREFGRSGD